VFRCVRKRQAGALLAVLFIASYCSGFPAAGHAHEMRPAVVDLSFTEDGRAKFYIRLNLEALIADVGPQHDNTSDSPNAAEYDALRRLPPSGLRKEFNQFRDRFLEGISIRDQDGRILETRVASLSIDEIGDTDLARSSTIALLAEPEPDTRSIVWSWDPRFGPNVLRLAEPGDGEGYSAYLTGGGRSEPIPMRGAIGQSAGAVIWNYLVVGFTHIVPKGLDHILFVVGLFLLSTRLRPLLIQVTSFTVAHTVTLALGVTGVVTLSPSVVEPLIAASIVYVAVENISSSKLHAWRPLIVFGFGLLHGLGFAGVLTEIGISESYFVTALVSFNVGVELGQIAVILGCFVLVGLWFRGKSWYRAAITIPASAVVALIGAYWFMERTVLA